MHCILILGTQYVDNAMRRFIEELGRGSCYGVSILRVLKGSGYALYRADAVGLVEADKLSVLEGSCGLNSTDKAFADLLMRLEGFYDRAERLIAEDGLQDLYSRTEFGVRFEAEQRHILNLS
jgi:hypothetical protein